MKKFLSHVLAMSLFADLGLTVYSEKADILVGNDGEKHPVNSVGSHMYIDNKGMEFHMTDVKGRYENEIGEFFYDGTYNRSAKLEYVPRYM